MKSRDILDALNDIDFDMVEEAMQMPIQSSIQKQKKASVMVFLRYSILVACISLFATFTVTGAPMDSSKPAPNNENTQTESKLPTFGFLKDDPIQLEFLDSFYLWCNEENVTYTFLSADESIVTVNQHGLVKPASLGSTVITVMAENDYGKTQLEIPITILDSNPYRTEVNTIIRQVPQNATLTWANYLLPSDHEYNFRPEEEMKEAGPVQIAQNKLYLNIQVTAWELEDMDPYDLENVSLDIYYWLNIPEFDNPTYKKVTLYPDSAEPVGDQLQYRVKFYDQMKDDIRENMSYGTVIVLKYHDRTITLGRMDELNWTDSCMTQIEYALARPNEIEK